MNQTNRLNKPKYLAVSTAALLMTAFVLVQPAMQTAYAVGLAQNEVPAYDRCTLQTDNGEAAPEDGISMNTVKNGNIVKTIHAEKEIFHCYLVQGELQVEVDLTTYLEVYENITSQKVIETNAFSTTCLKDGPTSSATATVIDCKSEEISTSPVFVGSGCTELDVEFPQEMNTVNKGKIAKTMEAQKETFRCENINGSDDDKKVDIVLFTEIYEDLNTQTTTSVQFLSARCVVLESDGPTFDDELQDASVESCIFTQIEN